MTDTTSGQSPRSSESKASLKERLALLPAEKLALLQRQLRQGGSKGYQPIGRGPEVSEHPLTFHQQRLWFIEQLQPGLPLYHVHRAMRIRGALDYTALQAAVQAVFERHESLRTTFQSTDGEPVQRIERTSPLEFPIEDLADSAANGEELESSLQRRLTAEGRRVFDLAADPLIRTRLYRIGDAEHVLQITIHHLVCDGWSFSVFHRELNEFYSAFVTGDACSLPKPSLRYVDFARWQREPRQLEQFTRRTEWWKRKLDGASTTFDFPTDQPRPRMETGAGDFEPLALSSTLLNELEKLGREENATLFMTLLAGFWIVLSRQSEMEDFLIASATAGRQRPETHDLIGFFVDTVVLRADLTGAPTAREVLRRARDTVIEAMNYSDVPFERVVESVTVPRDLSRHSLFQVMFNFPPQYSLKLHDLEISPVHVNPRTSRFDLEMTFAEGANRLTGIFYNSDLFHAETIRRLLSQYRVVLEGMVANADRRASELPLLTESERSRILTNWNDTSAEYPRELCLHQLFERQARKTPDAVAVRFEGQALTYRDLNGRANRLAHRLSAAGVGPECLVGICLERSANLIVAILGVLKAGGAYVPFDPRLPPERLDFMIQDSEIRALVTENSETRRLSEQHTDVLNVNFADPADSDDLTMNLHSGVGPSNLAYVMYTSGSTGRPKGVEIVHSAVVNFLTAMRVQPGLSPTDRLLSVTTPTFDISVLEFFLPLTVGACVEIAGAAETSDADALAERLAASGATVMQATPATWQMLCLNGWKGRPDLKALCGGEALSDDLAAKLLARCGELWNMYGPTETTIWSTMTRVVDARLSGSIGKPIANTQIYILDERMEPAPIGVKGELYIGGAGLARGYRKQPALTASRFVPNPFCPIPGSRLYRTGDVCRWLNDGNVQFQGRRDYQVKLRGFRIELGEIESVLRGQASVNDAVVVLREDQRGSPQLVAYCIPATPEWKASAVAEGLRRTLPDYMVPSLFVQLGSFPLTSSGKIDRKALPIPEDPHREPDSGFEKPRDLLEERLAQLWAETLGVRQIGIHDGFFESGGHSLLAVRLFARIQETFGRKLPLATVFERGTIADMAQLLRQRSNDGRIVTTVRLRQGATGRPLFILPGITGELISLRPLIDELGDVVPVLGVQPDYSPHNLEHFRDFRTSAGHCLAAIRERQPKGPYALVGYSYAGNLAYEVACQLEQIGEQVALLAIVDTGPRARNRAAQSGNSLQWLFRILANFPFWLREELRDFSAMRLGRNAKRKLRYLARRLTSRGRAGVRFDDVFNANFVSPEYLQSIRTRFDAFLEYELSRFSGELTLFRARSRPLFAGSSPDLGWSEFADTVRIIPVDGNHETILQPPHVSKLARRLTEILLAFN